METTSRGDCGQHTALTTGNRKSVGGPVKSNLCWRRRGISLRVVECQWLPVKLPLSYPSKGPSAIPLRPIAAEACLPAVSRRPVAAKGLSFSSLCLVPQDLVTASPTADDEKSAPTDTAGPISCSSAVVASTSVSALAPKMSRLPRFKRAHGHGAGQPRRLPRRAPALLRLRLIGHNCGPLSFMVAVGTAADLVLSETAGQVSG